MFKRIQSIKPPTVTIQFEGKKLQVGARETVAAAILATDGVGFSRKSPVSGRKRAPYCLMGICFECLMEIDGVPNRQACMTMVTDDMDVKRQRGRRNILND